MLTPAEASRIILETISSLPSERVVLMDALDRVLSEDLQSPLDLPPWDNSAMDGYAVRGVDVRDRCPVLLDVVEEVPAGTFPAKALRANQCTRIFTGAPVPDGADTVIRQEDTTAVSTRRVRVDSDRDAGRNIRRRAEDIPKGATILTAGTELGPAQLGLLAAAGQAHVNVHRRPRVAIMTSGDEVTDLDEREAILSGRKIASSNTYTLLALVKRAGGDAVDLGIARDDPSDLRRRLTAAEDVDLIVTSGGVSVGEHDYLRSTLRDLGADMRFWRIRMRPGAPVGFAILKGVPWIGLPGNPVSTMVTFELFVRPAIRGLLGHHARFRRTVSVRTGEPIELLAPLRHFFRVTIDEDTGERTAFLTGPQGSGVLSSMARADALLIVPEDQMQIPAGQSLQAMYLNEPVHVATAPF